MSASMSASPSLSRVALKGLLALCVVGGSLDAARSAEVTVSAAASLTNAFTEIGHAFEAQNAGTKVLLNTATSDALLQQIAKGAPADVFASADQESMDRADAQKLTVGGTRVNFVGNRLVVVMPGDSALPLRSLPDLQQAAVKRVTLGNPASVPAGRYAKAALAAARLWPAIEAKAVYGQSVRQSLDYVARGEADAGFVYATDALIQKGRVKVAFTVPTETPVVYPIALIEGSPNPSDGRKFIAFVVSPAGQDILAKYGFQRP